MRIYVIGPVSGFDDLNRPAFEDARRTLRKAGYTPLVPHDFIPPDAAWQSAMRRSLETLAKADGVACLPDWSKSSGALIEVETAQGIGIPTLHVDDWMNLPFARKSIELSKSVKLCPRCRRVIPLLLFDKSASSVDGRQSYCRACMAGYTRDRRADEQT